MTATETPPKYKYVGTRPIRHDGLEKVTGKARYAADLVLPAMLHGHILRSPHAHARIVSIDTSAAESMPGVRAVITKADFPELPVGDEHRQNSLNLMARDKVFYEGHAVAAVAAGTRAQAKEAAEAIEVVYEVLDHVLSLDEAMADGASVLHDDMITRGVDPAPTEASNVAARTCFERGDVEAGFAASDVVVEREFSTTPIHQGYIEPHAVVADTGQDGKSTVWGSSQGHFRVRSASAGMLGWDTARLKVIPAEIGGGFGGKTTIYLEPLAVMLSYKAARPVKIVMTRDEVFRATGPTPGSKMKLKVGATNDGTIQAVKAWMAYENGAFSGMAAMLGCMTVVAPYKMENMYLEGFDVVLNKPVNQAYRAPSAPMAALAMDTIVDEVASEIGMDPIEFRLKNCPGEGDPAPYGPKFPVIGLRECLEAIRDSDHYQDRKSVV